MGFFKFTPQRLPGPGAGNMALEPTNTLPPHKISGPGKLHPQVFGAMQPQQKYYGQAKTYIGFEGENAGTLGTAPLIEMARYVEEMQSLARGGE